MQTEISQEAARAMLAALRELLLLTDEMTRFVGKMSLQDYARLNAAPVAARAAIALAEAR